MNASIQLRVLVLTGLAAAASCGPSRERADAIVGDGPTVDASPFGTACETSSECPDGGFCVEGYGGRVCTYACDLGCPETWDCRAITVDGSLQSVCVPPDFELCTPCSGDTQCGGGVCVSLGGDAFCLPTCPFEGQCPSGYDCGADPTGQHPGQFCVPQTRSCSCTSGADEGQVRTCTNTNASGTCPGLETCHPSAGGWTGCTAPAASAETCDGLDNDCDQLIDDGLTNTACAITVAGVGTCPGVTLCTGAAGTICQGPTPQLESCNFADDDCDSLVDETFPGIGTVCTAGIGGCERVGVIRCTAAGTGTECSAVAGAPASELCNGTDDDCDGMIDDTFPTKGDPCAVGVGACARQGNEVCSASGLGTVCSVQPGPPAAIETCNALDDDCDGKTDEGFLDPTSSLYDQDTACGSCAVDCTVLYDLANASGHCVVAGSPGCVMTCAPGAFDLDGASATGCELLLDAGAIYVSVDDPAAVDDAGCGLGPVGTGAGNHPCQTIAQGLARANTLGRPRVLVANGIYTESVTLANGRSLLGGYASDTWQRDVASTGTLILGVSSAGNHDRTVVASNITAATVFEGFVVFGAVNAKVSGNSYAIYVAGSNANLAIKNNLVFGGRGGPGSNGSIGLDGTPGSIALGRNPNLGTSDAAYDAHDATGTGACDLANSRQYANGGATSCGGDDVSGGAGGGNQCPASPSALCTGCGPFGCTACTFVTATSTTGLNGQPGAGGGGGAGGAGAARGDDMIAGPNGAQIGYPCYIPAGLTYGRDGVSGSTGANGAPVAGCSASNGGVIGGNWVGNVASAGVSGANGGGGGGGGAGGGAKCQNCQGGKDKLGGHGGGGGAGGCGGMAGGGATAGGGAFGIFIVGGTAPVVTGNSVFRGGGGVGGVGGAGGKGGPGGAGAAGGTTGVPATFCSDVAGRGGNGGGGGHGSGGGGGCGGSSYGIYTSGIGAPNYCQAAATNTFSGGGGGSGGAGGYSLINPGGSGLSGALFDCSFN